MNTALKKSNTFLVFALSAVLAAGLPWLTGCGGGSAVLIAALASVSPANGQQGQSQTTVTITGTGTHFAQGTTTADFEAGITVNSVTVGSATSATANITISPTTNTGPRTVTLTTGTELVKLTNGFTVLAGPAAITTVNATAAQQGQALNVAITGTSTHFAQGTTTADFGFGITVSSLTVNSATSATAGISVTPTAATGPRNVTLTTGGEVATLANGFTVQAGPSAIASIAPNSGQQGQTLSSVVITGTATHFAQGSTTASFGNGITVNSLTVGSATSATANISISATATTGTNPVTLTTGGEVATLAGAFTILPGTPALASINPNSGQQGQALASVTITGAFTHFVQGTTAANFGSGITVNSLSVSSATSATASITISPTTNTGARTVTVTTGAEVVTLASGFTVTAGGAIIASVNPNTGTQGQTLTSVTITGTSTHFAQGTTTASFGAGITVNSLTVNSTTSATANITISATAATGARNVSLTTGGEVATLNNAFTVQAGTAVITTVNPNSGQQGQTLTSVAITGSFTHFVQGTTTASFGAGITVNTLTVNSATSASANITILPTTNIGARSVTLTTGGEVATLSNGFTVQTGPAAISSVNPNSGQQGETLANVIVTGTSTNFAQGTTVANFGAGITVNSVTVTSLTSATVSITIAVAAATGARNVTMTTGGEVATLANGFTVLAAPLAITTTSLANATVGVAYDQAIQTSGGDGTAITFSVASGFSLPAWASLNSSTGHITGTPAAGDVGTSPAFKISATQTGTTVTSGSLSITVVATGGNNSALNGHYAFVLRGFDPGGTAVNIGGTFAADGAGNVTGGVMDFNAGSNGVFPDLTITPAPISFYSVGADNRGRLTLVASSGTFAGTFTFDFALGGFSSGVASLGHIIDRLTFSATTGSAISGILKKQDTSAFTFTATNGDWALGGEGTDGQATHGRIAEAGRFTLTNGTISNGMLDVNDNGSFTGQAPFSGSFGSIDTTNGRAVLTILLAGKNFQNAVYIVSGNSSGKGETLFAKIDNDGGTFAGSGLQQSTTWCPTTGDCSFTNNALNGNAVVYIQSNSGPGAVANCSTPGVSSVQVGALTFTPGVTGSCTTGACISGGLDANFCGTIATPSTNPATGTYSVAANGRVTITSGGKPPFLYMVDTNHAFLIGTSTGRVEAGVGEPQVGPIAFASHSEAFGTQAPAVSGEVVFSGVQKLTATSATSAMATNSTVDLNFISGGLHENDPIPDFTAALDPTTGRFTFNDGTSGTSPRVGYFINSSRRVVINADPTVTTPFIVINDDQ